MLNTTSLFYTFHTLHISFEINVVHLMMFTLICSPGNLFPRERIKSLIKQRVINKPLSALALVYLQPVYFGHFSFSFAITFCNITDVFGNFRFCTFPFCYLPACVIKRKQVKKKKTNLFYNNFKEFVICMCRISWFSLAPL